MEQFKTWEEMTVLEQYANTYSDLYKDAYGVRPRGTDFLDWTEEEFRKQFARLEGTIKDRVDEDRRFEEMAARDFEERVNGFLYLGAKDRAMALRWIMEADGADDFEHLCFKNGLRYGYFAK